jgi:hypothetical protein
MRRYATQRIFSYPSSGKAALLSPATNQQLKIYAAYLINRAGAANTLGLLRKFGDSAWKLGTVADASSPDLTDQTSTIQAGSPINIFTTTVNDGFLIQSPKPFNFIGVTLTQAQTGAPVYAIEYWNGAAWTAVPMLATPDLTSIGDKIYLFAPPADWAVGQVATVGVDADKYAIRIRATTAGGQAVIANDAWVAELVAYQEQVPHAGVLGYVLPDQLPDLWEGGEELMPYFSTAFAGNLVDARYYRGG